MSRYKERPSQRNVVERREANVSGQTDRNNNPEKRLTGISTGSRSRISTRRVSHNHRQKVPKVPRGLIDRSIDRFPRVPSIHPGARCRDTSGPRSIRIESTNASRRYILWIPVAINQDRTTTSRSYVVRLTLDLWRTPLRRYRDCTCDEP